MSQRQVGPQGHFLLGCDTVYKRGQIHISIEMHVVQSQQVVTFILYCVQKILLLDRFLKHKTPVHALAHRFLMTCSTTVLFMPSSSNSSLCFSRTKFMYQNPLNRTDKDYLLIMGILNVYWAQNIADIAPNFTLIAHVCSACCGKIHFERMNLLWCPGIFTLRGNRLKPRGEPHDWNSSFRWTARVCYAAL